MAPPEDWDGRTEQLPDAAAAAAAAATGNSYTRRAGGRVAARGPPTVVVDVREFRSALPNMLHLHGVSVKPVTLEVRRAPCPRARAE
eukprot:3154007-Prymnesium_polylepis.1